MTNDLQGAGFICAGLIAGIAAAGSEHLGVIACLGALGLLLMEAGVWLHNGGGDE